MTSGENQPLQVSRRPKLLDQVRAVMRLRRCSRRTEEAYLGWIKRFIVHHGMQHPAQMGGREVAEFLTSLAVRGRVSASTQNQALAALLFLYRRVLEQNLPWMRDIVRARRPPRIPVVLTRQEVRLMLDGLVGMQRLMALLMYGAGLRLLECCRLRVKDIDFATNQITVRCGKGSLDRVALSLCANMSEARPFCIPHNEGVEVPYHGDHTHSDCASRDRITQEAQAPAFLRGVQAAHP